MSKKINVTENTAIDATNAVTCDTVAQDPATTFDLEAAMLAHPNVSLRKLAIACECSYGWVLKCAKKPIPGVPFDPEAINYDAVMATFTKKGIDLGTLDWDALDEAAVRRGTTLTKDMSAFAVGTKVYLREDNAVPYEIVYKTETHIVILKDGDTEPHAWSHGTFLMKGPVFQPRAISNETEADAQ